jgi:hypothetical protein
LDKHQLYKEVLMDMGTNMIGGIGAFVKTTDVPGGYLQLLHGVDKNTL